MIEIYISRKIRYIKTYKNQLLSLHALIKKYTLSNKIYEIES